MAVDDSIYRRLPAFLIATVDKFATLPWIAESGVLLGGATRHTPGKGFAGPGERTVGWGTLLPSSLPAPEPGQGVALAIGGLTIEARSNWLFMMIVLVMSLRRPRGR